MSTKKDNYTLLGVDPGTNIMGYAILHVQGKQLTVPDMGVISMQHLESHQYKLKRIFERLQRLIHHYQPKEMAVEAPFYGKNVQSMLKLGRAQGVAIAAAITNDVEVTEYAPKRIKQAITGSGNASKDQVAAMLESILKVEFDQTYLDASDALGAALCHYYSASSKLKGQKRYNDWGAYLKDNPGKVK